MRIREFSPADSVAELTAFLHRAYAPLAAAGMKYLASHQEEEVTRRRISKGECYVAEIEGRIVGTITLRDTLHTQGSPWYDRPDVASFGQFAVEPALQGQGIGSALIEHVERRAREKGLAELACDTAESAEHLIRMYEKRGYRFVERVEWPVTNYRSVILSKRLA